ncbi:hypothetical protein GBF38_019566 [Nibea albiflora]|uniref:Uncharacterized protein n=1 Tax=Nibea albiflora TaxID=240163 RepID=A0ACB7F2S1_NIBAL|nr:hypothetical protein GBF38_019566 [Nibea albiflora]
MKISAIFPLLLLVCSVSAYLQQPYWQDIHALLKEISVTLAQQKVEMRFLQRMNQVKQVAFSASLMRAGQGYIGPFSRFTTLVFEHVLTDIGMAYNNHTGIFTAPVRGAYHFEWYIGAHGGPQAAGAVLVKNAEHTFLAYEHQRSDYGTSSNGVTLLLEVNKLRRSRRKFKKAPEESPSHSDHSVGKGDPWSRQ